MLSCESAGQQQRRHIAARDHQHQHGRERQPQHDASGSPEDVRTQRHDVRVPVSIGDGKFGCDRPGNDVHLRLRLFNGDARAQFRDDVERPVVAPFILLWEQRLPEIDPVVDAWDGHLRDGAAVVVGGQRRKIHVGPDDAEHQVRRRPLSA